MYEVTNKSFNSSVVGTDPVTKGEFIIEWAHMLWNDDEEDFTFRARGNFLIRGDGNPLYVIAKESPLRLQGLVASVMFGIEKKFIKFESIPNFEMIEDGFISEIEMTVVFEILDNLEYLENVIIYKEDNLL